MNANMLALNRDETQLILMAKENVTKSTIRIPAVPVHIVPKDTLKFLGVQLSDKLNWKSFLIEGKGNLLSQLKTIVRNFASAIFIGKLNYAAELWGGAPQYIIKKFKQSNWRLHKP